MCTLALALRATPGSLLLVSGNRNEFLGRPAVGPQLYPAARRGAPAVWMPRDEQAGGTWLGVNDRGLFICLTNRREGQNDPSRGSRGQLVVEALQQPTVSALRDFLIQVPANRHNGFHLVFASTEEAGVLVCDGQHSGLLVLPPGEVHVITERSYGAGEGERERVVRDEFRALLARGEPDVAALREPMRRHADGVAAAEAPGHAPMESACVHADSFGYGTRSSLQLTVPVQGAASALWTDGHPCTEPARDLSAQVAPLFALRPGALTQ